MLVRKENLRPLDRDATVVEMEREKGHPVYYGDVRKPELFRSACARNAEVIIVTLDDPKATENLLVSLRELYPDTSIYVRGQNLDHCRKLRSLGATGVVSENFEASMELARKALIRSPNRSTDLSAACKLAKAQFIYSCASLSFHNSGFTTLRHFLRV